LSHFTSAAFGVLTAAGADLLACETIPVLDEARAYSQLLGPASRDPAWFSFTSPDGVRTSHGEPLADCARLADGVASVIAVGVNCVKPEIVGEAIRSLKTGTGKPIVVYPNSGERWDAGDESWHGKPADRSLGGAGIRSGSPRAHIWSAAAAAPGLPTSLRSRGPLLACRR
jgi:homocysteine S-methyltransferase